MKLILLFIYSTLNEQLGQQVNEQLGQQVNEQLGQQSIFTDYEARLMAANREVRFLFYLFKVYDTKPCINSILRRYTFLHENRSQWAWNNTYFYADS